MRKQIGTFDAFDETMEKMRGEGILLIAGVPPNPMTIGWGTLGYVWSKPVFVILVRPNRYTFELIENVKDFTINVLPKGFNQETAICGTESGRDIDKVAKCNFDMKHGECSNAFYISQSVIHYECRIIHKNKVDPGTLEPSIIDTYYEQRDFHTIYYGEILGVFKT
ncbi:MAG: flavin reductase [Bacteroidetes bacterium]|nr:flavin reductase [Bacteroidota bacterium]